MNTPQTDYDINGTLLTLDTAHGKRGPIVTAYVNGMSLRCNTLHLERIRDIFIDTVVFACDTDEADEAPAREILSIYIKAALGWA
jgi:hypothetical protein